jgi:eukaryotic translation initiation factor 2-alpha kinase 4
VPWLQQQIAEQKRVDASTSGAPVLSETALQTPVATKDSSSHSEVYLALPVDVKKASRQKKQIFVDKGVPGMYLFL